MSYDAKVFNVFIASPNDLTNERKILGDVIHEWNAVHSNNRKIVLLPVRWETHVSPEIGRRPQAIVNQVLDKSDLLVGVFWTRLGTSTGGYPSGTAEEIDRHVKAGKPAMLYFSNAPVRQDSVDIEQWQKLKEFKDAYKGKSLYETYDELGELKEKFYHQLQLKINDDAYFKVSASEPSNQVIPPPGPLARRSLSPAAQVLLKEASADPQGTILHVRTFDGTSISTNGRNLITDNEARTTAKWEGALRELIIGSLIRDRGAKGEVFALTNEGYELADLIRIKPD